MKVRALVYLTITVLCETDPALCNVRIEAKKIFQISEAGAEAEEIVEHLNLLLRSGGTVTGQTFRSVTLCGHFLTSLS